MRPGVYVQEQALPRVVEPPSGGISAGAFVGTALMGPTDPVLLTSWSQFVSNFGAFSGDSNRTSLAPAVYQFFVNGGGLCYVCRVLASDAQAASLTLVDPIGEHLLAIESKSPGYWGNGLSVDVHLPVDLPKAKTSADGPFSMDFKVDFDRPEDFSRPLVNLDGKAIPTFDLVVRNTVRGASVVVERFNNVSMDPDHGRYVERVVNDFSVGSTYITATDVHHGNAIGNYPAAVERAPLTGGSDGHDPINAGSYSDAVDRFALIEGNLVFNAPGVSDASGLEVAVQARGDSFLVVDAPNVGDIKKVLEEYSYPSTSYSAVYYPYIGIADPDPTAVRGAVRMVPPGGSVVGMILRTDASRGSFKAPAGIGASLSGALAVAKRLSNAELDELNAHNINAIRPVPGSGITVMGARTRDMQSIAKYISVRRTLNFIKEQVKKTSMFALFEPNTPSLWEQLRVANGAFLSELWQVGGLAGRTFDEGFYVKVDSDNNTPQTISAGEVHIEIGVAPVFPAEFVIIRLGSFEADASFLVTEEE
jgi:hypothetical protein